ncbi:hypothetical protein M9458_028953, partial [Cirrhinus mrigala]
LTLNPLSALTCLPACISDPPSLSCLIHLSLPQPCHLSPDSPSAHPQPTIGAVGFVADLPVSNSVMAGGSLISTSSLRVLDSASALRLSVSAPAPDSLVSTIAPPAPPGSLVPPALPWSVVDPPLPQDSAPLAAPRCSVLPALLGASLHPSPPRLPEPWPPDPLCCLESAALRLRLKLHLHLLRRRLSVPWSRQPFLHPGSSLLLIHPGPFGLLLGSSLRRLYYHGPPWNLFVGLLLGVHPPPEPPPALTSCFLPTSTP